MATFALSSQSAKQFVIHGGLCTMSGDMREHANR